MNIFLKSLFTFSSVLVLCTGVKAQSEPQFTQYMYNKYLFNPATAGSDDALGVRAIHRSQYVGLANRFIASQGLNIDMPIYAISSGVGITVINDLIGFQRTTYGSVNYDYRKKFKWGNLGIGVGLGFIQTSLDGSKIRTPKGSYEGGFDHNDPYLPIGVQNGSAPDLSFGIFFNSNKYFAGASINHIAFSIARPRLSAGNLRLNFSRNLFFTGGYDFEVNSKLKIMPTALVKTDLVQVQADISCTFTIINNIITGISLRGYTKNMIDALALTLGFRYKGFQLLYSYDANLSYLTRFNTGSHEISLSYLYSLKKKESRGYLYHNPRFN